MTEPSPPEIIAAPDPATPVITRASFATSTTRALAEAMTQANDPLSVNRRWGTIAAINTVDDSVSVTLGGEVIEGIKYDAGYTPIVGEYVYMDIVGSDVTVMGTMAPSLHNPGQRRGTVTSISADRETVNVTVDDGTLLTAVPVLASYDPVLNDQVHLSSYQGSFLVIGSLDRTTQTYRRAVGDIEPSFTIKPGTLALNGQVVSRTTYANLWSWVQANGLVAAGLFTAGDGATTFGLPDFRGRVLVGAGVFGGVTWNVGTTAGANTITLATNQMPSHNHSVAVATHGTHDHAVTTTISTVAAHQHTGGTDNGASTGAEHTHSGTTGGGGGHGHNILNTFGGGAGHDHFSAGRVSEGSGQGTLGAGIGTQGAGDHTHGFGTTVNGLHTHGFTTNAGGGHSHTATTDVTAVSAGTHTVTEASVGGTTAVDVRQPSVAVQIVIWV